MKPDTRQLVSPIQEFRREVGSGKGYQYIRKLAGVDRKLPQELINEVYN